eukprot:TRINITY_DN9417_c1_g3_i2.p1 TRINITY_DN9417_c1_g3~~TRINITY_DN9417_c1_g3_i2.p1  ORF type:complete len:103 (+),score=1.44 TRINITY_DN9417_c1_g3_i2:326-634(+)
MPNQPHFHSAHYNFPKINTPFFMDQDKCIGFIGKFHTQIREQKLLIDLNQTMEIIFYHNLLQNSSYDYVAPIRRSDVDSTWHTSLKVKVNSFSWSAIIDFHF